MKDLFKKAHILTRNIIETYGDVDYHTQFKLCLDCVIEIENKLKEIDTQNSITKILNDTKGLGFNVSLLGKNLIRCRNNDFDLFIEYINNTYVLDIYYYSSKFDYDFNTSIYSKENYEYLLNYLDEIS